MISGAPSGDQFSQLFGNLGGGEGGAGDSAGIDEMLKKMFSGLEGEGQEGVPGGGLGGMFEGLSACVYSAPYSPTHAYTYKSCRLC